jgi:Gpi18-like mannosyltransferase
MKWILVVVFLLRFGLSLIAYNGDLNNHFAWVDSIRAHGWHGLYERDMSPWAAVNYPPLTLYTFAASESLYRHFPSVWQTAPVRASLYKIPNILADCLIAWFIWSYTKFSNKVKIGLMSVFLLNPALAYNSIWWGQIESTVTCTAILSLLLLTENKAGFAIISFVVALLLKQNALPLIPIMVIALWHTKPRVKELIGAILISLCLVYFSYLPLTPAGSNPVVYGVHQYISSVGGQPHQHEASVNALNFWYAFGYNHVLDSQNIVGRFTLRNLSTIFTGIGVLLAGVYAYLYRRDKYQSLFISASILTLWIFVFTSRMHERHAYTYIALMIMCLPSMRRRWPYVALSLIGFYNLFGVWSEYFNYNRGLVSWENWTRLLSWAVVLLAMTFPLWLLPRKNA